MVTYSVRCNSCGKEMLFEQPAPMDEPGELSAFCSNECSRRFGKTMLQGFVDAGSMMVDLPCGCFACVHSVMGNGSTMPWIICEAGRGPSNHAAHSNDIHHQAVAIARRRLIRD